MMQAGRVDRRNLRIALFSGNYNYLKEGANQALNILVRYLETKGHVVRVYSPVTDTPAFEPAGTLVPVSSVTLPLRSEFQLALGLPHAVRMDIERFAPDIVHVSTPDILDTRAQTFAIKHGIKVVASQHTVFEAYLDYYGLGWLKPLAEAHLNRFYRRSDRVLAPTPMLVERMDAICGPGKTRLWGRGVDTAQFDPARRDMAWRRAQGLADDDIVLLFFGRLVLEKGVASFVEVVRRLLDRGQRVRTLVVGAGPAKAALAALPDVVFTGHLQDEPLWRAIASADIFLNPSRTEAFGNVVLEAMASGLPVVSADAQSAAALIEQGRTGWLCPADQPETYADAIAALIADPHKRLAAGQAARAASTGHSWDAVSQCVENAYLELLASRS